jgi:hypothetical protein
MPEDPSGIFRTAFAQTTGHLFPDPGLLLITLTPHRALRWRHAFGSAAPFDSHIRGLIGEDDFRGTFPDAGWVTLATPNDPTALDREVEAIRKAHSVS